MSEEEDFEEQLQQEQIAKVEAEEAETANQGLTFTDTDGTVMEWDPARKAYFPKIDSDFIARYQMSYGSNTEGQTAASATVDKTCRLPGGSDSREWQDYYSYYNQHGSNPSSVGGDGKGSYSTQDMYNYYAYYHGEDYAKKWLNTQEEEQQEEDGEQRDEAEDKGQDGKNDNAGNKKRKAKDKKERGTAKPKPPEQPPAWFEMNEETSTHVYVSGLPSKMTEEEFKELMAKCGLIMFDPLTSKPKLKLYHNPDGSLKGDGLCCYIKQESVDLALKILDGSNVKGSIITVERARFQLKGQFDPTKKKKKLSNKAKKKFKEKQAKLFDWRPDVAPGTRFRFERIVILKNMFDPTEFENEPTLINELRDDVRTECLKFGDVRKVQVYDHHAEGVISVTFRTPEEGDACVAAMKGRWFAKRQIQAETYDGRTKYEVKESDAEREERLKGWEKFLETEADKGQQETGADKGQQEIGADKGQQETEAEKGSVPDSGHQGQAVSLSRIETVESSSGSEAASAGSSGEQYVSDHTSMCDNHAQPSDMQEVQGGAAN